MCHYTKYDPLLTILQRTFAAILSIINMILIHSYVLSAKTPVQHMISTWTNELSWERCICFKCTDKITVLNIQVWEYHMSNFLFLYLYNLYNWLWMTTKILLCIGEFYHYTHLMKSSLALKSCIISILIERADRYIVNLFLLYLYNITDMNYD